MMRTAVLLIAVGCALAPHVRGQQSGDGSVAQHAAASRQLQFALSELTKLTAAYERVRPEFGSL